jgi:hypothetical protein
MTRFPAVVALLIANLVTACGSSSPPRERLSDVDCAGATYAELPPLPAPRQTLPAFLNEGAGIIGCFGALPQTADYSELRALYAERQFRLDLAALYLHHGALGSPRDRMVATVLLAKLLDHVRVVRVDSIVYSIARHFSGATEPLAPAECGGAECVAAGDIASLLYAACTVEAPFDDWRAFCQRHAPTHAPAVPRHDTAASGLPARHSVSASR